MTTSLSAVRQVALVTVLGLVLGVIMTFPMMSAPGRLARTDSNDGKFSVWNVAWVAHALTDSSEHVFDANIFYPHTGTLAYSEANLVAGAVAAPIYAVSKNPVLAHNLVVFLALVAAFVWTWWLIRRVSGSAGAALAPAAAFAFSAYVSAHTAHIQLLLVFVVPMILLALHRCVEAPSPGRGVQLGLALAVGGLACAYYGLMMGLAVAWGAIWFGWRHHAPRRYWAAVALAAVVSVAGVAPALAPYAELRREDNFRSALNLDEANSYSADLRTYMRGHGGRFTQVLPDSMKSALTNYVGRNGEVLFPGLVILGLATLGLLTAVRHRGGVAQDGAPEVGRGRVLGFYLSLSLLAVWAAMGPRAGLYSALAEWVPFMSFLRAPARMGVLVLFGLSMFAGLGSAWLVRRTRIQWLAPLVLALVVVELQVPWPLRTVPPVPGAYRVLAEMPRAGVLILQFPYKPGEWFPHAEYMFWSMWHWQPMLNGYSDFIPEDIRDLAVPVNGFPDSQSFQILKARGIRYVAIDWRTYNEAATGIIRDRFPPYAEYVRPLFEDAEVSLYEIVGWPDEGATFR